MLNANIILLIFIKSQINLIIQNVKFSKFLFPLDSSCLLHCHLRPNQLLPLLRSSPPMAETSDKIPPPNRRLHFLLRCFGSSPKIRTGKDPATVKPTTGRRNRRILWLRSRFKKSSATVPVDTAVPEITDCCHDEGFSSPKLKKPAPIKSKAPAVPAYATESTRPSRLRTKASQTRKNTESTRSDSTAGNLPSATRTASLLHSVSLPARRLNRQKDLKKAVSQIHAGATAPAPKPSTNSPAKFDLSVKTNPRKKFDPVIIMSAVAITVLWGRLCAILCTAALFYLGRRLSSVIEPDGGGERSRDLKAENRLKRR